MKAEQAALIGAAGLLAYGAWRLYQGQQAGEFDGVTETAGELLDTVTDTADTAAGWIDSMTGGTMQLSRMGRVTAADVRHPNVRALLAVIRRGEGTADAAGYRRMFGGELFDSYADHPRKRITKTLGGKAITSTAAGAYQFLASTWDETARALGLQDFSPASQDLAAVGRIAARGALDDTKAGRLDAALPKIAKEWASMPGSPYGQPTISTAAAWATFANAGGVVA